MDDKPKVLVSGCYDLLHGGHIEFLRMAALQGELHVCIGSDRNIENLKDRPPLFSEAERLFIVRSIRFVKHARISSGTGILDFEPDMAKIKPDFFVVNEDGVTEGKRRLCEKHGVKLIVLPRIPAGGLPERSSTSLKAELAGKREADGARRLPYRICLAGGWLDQPFVSCHHPGRVITVNIEPTRTFNLRSGMATSTRKLWKKIAASRLFRNDPVELARLLFGYENPPGSQYVSGSQDHLGLTLPGINSLFYDRGSYWPSRIDSVTDDATCRWLEQSLVLVPLFERPDGYDPLTEQNITAAGVTKLAEAANACWEGIKSKDIKKLGEGLTGTHNAWARILPRTTTREIEKEMARYDCHGRITSGCGGGYLILAADSNVPGGFRIKIRRHR